MNEIGQSTDVQSHTPSLKMLKLDLDYEGDKVGCNTDEWLCIDIRMFEKEMVLKSRVQ